MNDVTKLLEDARSRIADPWNWTQLEFARDHRGLTCLNGSPEAVCWCARGSLYKSFVELHVTRGTYFSANHKLGEFANLLYGTTITRVNDFLGHEATLKMFDDAIAHSKAEYA